MSISTITISGDDFTSYASRAEANTYLVADPVRATTWAALTDANKDINLVAATRRLDMLSWVGVKTGDYDTQENQWPRTGMEYADGSDVSTSEVPQAVENATCLLAGTIAIKAAKSEMGTSGSNIKGVKAGSAAVDFFRASDGIPLQDESAYALVKVFLEATAYSSALGPYAYGTDGESSFSSLDNWGRTRGFP